MNDPRNTEEKEAMAGANGASAVSLDRLIKNSDAAMLFRKFMEIHQTKSDSTPHTFESSRLYLEQLRGLFNDGKEFGF